MSFDCTQLQSSFLFIQEQLSLFCGFVLLLFFWIKKKVWKINWMKKKYENILYEFQKKRRRKITKCFEVRMLFTSNISNNKKKRICLSRILYFSTILIELEVGVLHLIHYKKVSEGKDKISCFKKKVYLFQVVVFFNLAQSLFWTVLRFLCWWEIELGSWNYQRRSWNEKNTTIDFLNPNSKGEKGLSIMISKSKRK